MAEKAMQNFGNSNTARSRMKTEGRFMVGIDGILAR